MIGLGTIVNVALILFGGTVGLIFKKIIPVRVSETIMQGLGLAVIFIGLSGALGSSFFIEDTALSARHILITIISLALGGLFGGIVGIEKTLEKLAEKCGKKFSSLEKSGNFAQGFITATLVFSVGSMSILGAINDGVSGNRDILFVKSALDGVSAMIFASTMGVGVLFSAVVVGVYQGLLTLVAVFVSPYLNDLMIEQITVLGSLLILAIGFNILKISKIKVADLLPSLIVPIFYNLILNFK